MKSKLIILSIVMFNLLVASQTQGELEVSVNTSETGGKYAPRHVLAIWIVDSQDRFVKTLLAYASERKTHLNTWQSTTNSAGSEYNVVDAMTGATKSSHTSRACKWDGTNYQGDEVADGSYKLYMELTDKNSTGNYTYYTFTKGGSAEHLSPGDVNSFSDVNVSWSPNASSIEISNVVKPAVHPNPSTGLFYINNTPNMSLQVWDVNGTIVFDTDGTTINLEAHPSGIYFLKINSGNSSSVVRLLKK